MGQVEDFGREARSFRPHHEHQAISDFDLPQAHASMGSQDYPFGTHRHEPIKQGRCGHFDKDRGAQETSRRSPEGARMIGMNGSRRQKNCVGAKGLGNANEGSEISRILQSIDKNVEGLLDQWKGFQPRARQRDNRQDTTRGIGIRNVVHDVGGYLSGTEGTLGMERLTLFTRQEFGRCQQQMWFETSCKGLADEVWPLQDRPVVFTAPEPANILNLLILTTDNHG